MSLSREQIKEIIALYASGKLQTDSDVDEYVTDKNAWLRTWTPEEEDAPDFYNSETYKSYLTDPRAMTHSDVMGVRRRLAYLGTDCWRCTKLLRRGGIFEGEPCMFCSRIHPVGDYFEEETEMSPIIREIVEGDSNLLGKHSAKEE